MENRPNLRIIHFSVSVSLFFSQLTPPVTASASTNNSGKIINGTAVYPPHKYPWTVATYFGGCFSDGYCPRSKQTCGATVINEHFILLAAHCCFLDIQNKNNLTIDGLFVLTGLHIREKLEPWSQNLSVAECIVHESFERDELMNDIALIRVNGKIQFSDKVTPVNLPPPDFDVESDGELVAMAVGWGRTHPTNGTLYPMELQEVTVPLITTDTCQRTYSLFEQYGENASFVITESMLCAGFEGKGVGTCTGDSGSPLMLLNPATNTYTQVGFVSSGTQPCARSYTVYTRVSKYVHWIRYHLQKCRPRKLV